MDENGSNENIPEKSLPAPEQPVPMTTPAVPKDAYIIKPIRTYRSDAEEAVEKDHTSVIDIAVAESKKREQTPIEYKKEKRSPQFLWFSFALILIALAVIGGTYYFWVVGSQTLEKNAQNSYLPLIQVESTQTVPLNSQNPMQSLSELITKTSSVPVGGIINLIPTGTNGVVIATSTNFFSVVGINLPTQMAISLDGTYMLGVLVSNPNHPFIVLGVSSFENAFAGMLGWEKTMRNDFGKFILIDHPTEALVPTAPETFGDTTIANQDVREILDASSSPILLYTFVGTTRLVIANDAATMETIVNRLNTTNTTR